MSTEAVARFVSLLAMLAKARGVLEAQPQTDLASTTIEDLLNLRITSISKTEQRFQRSAAAIVVITSDDVRRSGAAKFPDLLHMVPGFEVTQINSNAWAISSRGFHGRFSHDLLVMVDGRTVYVPTFGGVFWDVIDLPLGNIERIEVIRGPGGSIWGANAVNGVINIITKKTRTTSGARVEARGGNLDALGTLQYGGPAGNAANYRAYAKYLDHQELPGLNGRPGGDGWHMLRGGFRVDTFMSSRDKSMFQGDLYRGTVGGISEISGYPAPRDERLVQALSGGYPQGVWDHVFSSRSDTSLQVSYDDYERDDILMERRKTLSLDFQHHLALGERNSIVWGLGYRGSTSQSKVNTVVFFSPANLGAHLFSSFLQDDIAVVPDKLSLTLGAKVEQDNYTGLGIMPSARAALILDPHQTIWASISRALHTPSEADAALQSNLEGTPGPAGIPTIIRIIGNSHARNEVLLAYEMGHRTTTRNRLSLDVGDERVTTRANLAILRHMIRCGEDGMGFPHRVMRPCHPAWRRSAQVRRVQGNKHSAFLGSGITKSR